MQQLKGSGVWGSKIKPEVSLNFQKAILLLASTIIVHCFKAIMATMECSVLSCG